MSKKNCPHTAVNAAPASTSASVSLSIPAKQEIPSTHRVSDETPFLGALLSIQSFLRDVDVRLQLKNKSRSSCLLQTSTSAPLLAPAASAAVSTLLTDVTPHRTLGPVVPSYTPYESLPSSPPEAAASPRLRKQIIAGNDN